MRYKLSLRYIGSRFHGWQIQKNALTVQEIVNEKLSFLFHEQITTHGCSRTDSGVHALEFVCHFDSERLFPAQKLPLALNAAFPEDISANKCEIVPDSFHARFSCKGKKYLYLISATPFRNPFYRDRAYFIPAMPDVEKLRENAAAFLGEHDFSAFMAKGSSVQETVRRIDSFEVTRDGELLLFEVQGNGFLYNMVRIMAGTLLDSVSGKLSLSIPDIMDSRDRFFAGATLPPQGLYLKKVFY